MGHYPDVLYRGIEETAELLPFFVGAAALSRAARPAWVASREEASRVKKEIALLL